MSRQTNAAYVRKTDTSRREPGGLCRAVLILVNDGYKSSAGIARILETSIDNVNGALSRLYQRKMVTRPIDSLPVHWRITATGLSKVGDEEEWF